MPWTSTREERGLDSAANTDEEEAGVKYKSKAPANATTEDTCPVHHVVLALRGPEGVNSGLPTTLSRLLSFGSGFAFVAPPVMVGACEALRRFAGSRSCALRLGRQREYALT